MPALVLHKKLYSFCIFFPKKCNISLFLLTFAENFELFVKLLNYKSHHI
jgi:hypothetical protein